MATVFKIAQAWLFRKFKKFPGKQCWWSSRIVTYWACDFSKCVFPRTEMSVFVAVFLQKRIKTNFYWSFEYTQKKFLRFLQDNFFCVTAFINIHKNSETWFWKIKFEIKNGSNQLSERKDFRIRKHHWSRDW